MSAEIIRENGTRETIAPASTEEGFTLDELYVALDCDMVQIIELVDDQIMVIDDEGKLRPHVKPTNPTATALLHAAGGMPADYVVGPALVCHPRLIK